MEVLINYEMWKLMHDIRQVTIVRNTIYQREGLSWVRRSIHYTNRPVQFEILKERKRLIEFGIIPMYGEILFVK